MQAYSDTTKNNDRSWQKSILKYAHPDPLKSIWQILNSIIPYLAINYLMYLSLGFSYILTLLLAVLASGFLIRIFIIFHDCGHRSFFKSKKANNAIGILTSLFTFTPFHKWHQAHRIHHATSGNLDKRGVGDVWTMTVDEYLKSTPWERFMYRAFRNPFGMFLLGPFLVVFIQNRITKKSATPREKWNVHFTNISFLALLAIAGLIIGFKAVLLIQLPILLISHSIGIWLFYVQHQFDEVEWERQSKWDFRQSAVNGSSFLKLPAVLQWFTGNIGFHHVHHLSSMIPNYNLAKCHYENAIFDNVTPLNLFSAFKAMRLGLWDETNRRMVGFRNLSLANAGHNKIINDQVAV